MINLLPPAEKEILRRTYRRRFWIAAGIMLLAWLVLAIVLAAAFFWLVRFRRLAPRAAAELAAGEEQNALAQEKELTVFLDRTRSLAAAPEALRPTEAFLKVGALAGGQIKIYSFQLASDSELGGKLSIAGRAASRQELVAFIERLRGEAMFSFVESPIANLVQDRDADFSLILTLARHGN